MTVATTPESFEPLESAVARIVRGLAAPRPGIERHDASDRAAWLRLRERDVTASVAGALLGVHDYQTPYGLWALKSGAIVEDPDETPPMRRGRLLEPVALRLLGEERPDWRILAGSTYYRDTAARIGATPDAFAVDPARPGFGIVQIKTVEPSVFRRKWRDEDGAAEPPLWIAVQAIVEAELTGASWAVVACMTCGFGLDLHVVDVPLHKGVMARLRDAVATFWAQVESGRAPDPDFTRDAATIARLYATDDGGEADLSADNALPALLSEREALKSRLKGEEARLDEIDAEIRSKVGAAALATLPGWRISAKTVKRRPYAVAASSYRALRVTRTNAGDIL